MSMYTTLKCKCTIKQEHRTLIAKLFKRESYKFYVETDNPYIKLFNMPYNFGKFFELNTATNEIGIHNVYDETTGEWSFHIRFIEADDEWLWFCRLFAPLYIEKISYVRMGEKDFDWTDRVDLQLDKQEINNILKYLLVEPSASTWDWKKYQLKKAVHPADEIRRKMIREQNTLYLDITESHENQYNKEVLEYIYAGIKIDELVKQVNSNRFQHRYNQRYTDKIKALIFEEMYLPASFEVVLSEILEKLNNCTSFNQKELPEVSEIKLKFKEGNEVKINLSRVGIENQKVMERWAYDECLYDD